MGPPSSLGAPHPNFGALQGTAMVGGPKGAPPRGPTAGGPSSGGPSGGWILGHNLEDRLRRRLILLREELAKKGKLKTTKTIATNAAIDAVVRSLPSSLAQLQTLPFKELQGGKKVINKKKTRV